MQAATDVPAVIQHGTSFHVDVRPGRLFWVPPPQAAYRIVSQSPAAYDVDFSAGRPVTALCVSGGRLIRAGTVSPGRDEK